MTTIVTINAHCASDKQVVVKRTDHTNGVDVETFTLQDGEKADRVVFDGLDISVREVLKQGSPEQTN